MSGTRVTELGAGVGGLRRRREELVAAVEDAPAPGPIPPTTSAPTSSASSTPRATFPPARLWSAC